MKKAILKSIKIKEIVEDSPDLSYLGQFANQPKGNFSIEHEPNDSRSFNWFNAENVATDKEAQQNYERAASYGDSWNAIGIKAIAEIHIPFEVNGHETNYKIETIDSGGLWGIESDSDDVYKNEVAQDQIEELQGYLKTLNVSLKKFKEFKKEALSDYLLKVN